MLTSIGRWWALRRLNVADSATRIAAIEKLGRSRDAAALQPLVDILEADTNPKKVRAAAARALGAIGGTQAVRPLLGALADGGRDVREAAEAALGQLGSHWPRSKAATEMVPRLLAALARTGDRTAAVATALGAIGDSRAVEGLLQALGDASVRARRAAAAALGRIPDARTIERLAVALTDEDSEVRELAEASLSAIRVDWPGSEQAKRAVPALSEAVAHENADVRRAARAVLDRIEPGRPRRTAAPSALSSWLARLKDGDAHVRSEAAEALGEFGGTNAIEPLAAALGDSDSVVRWHARKALDKISATWFSTEAAKRAIPALAVAFHVRWYGTNEGTRIPDEAGDVLQQMGRAAVAPLIAALVENDALRLPSVLGLMEPNWRQGEGVERLMAARIAALEHRELPVRLAAADALAEIRDPRAVKPLIAELNDEDEEVRCHVVEALQRIGDVRAVASLVASLQDRSPFVRQRAAHSLRHIKDSRAVEPLAAALRDSNDIVRHSAAIALSEIGDTRAVDPLIGALRDKDWAVRVAAVEGLQKLGDRRAAGPVLALLQDETPLVRGPAARALADIGDASAIGPLLARLKDGDCFVRSAALTALDRIDPNWRSLNAAKEWIPVLRETLRRIPDPDVREAVLDALKMIEG